MAHILHDTPEHISQAVQLLASGRLVAIPTETVYGLAADALNEEACRSIFAVKGRPYIDPLIVHVADVPAAEKISNWNEPAKKLAKAFWPGPLTIVLPRRSNVPDIVTSGLDSVAMRSPAHPLARKLLQAGGLYLAAPSANPFGYISPTTAGHVQENLGGRIPAILDGGPCEIGLESTIVDMRMPATPVVLRPGSITAAQLGAVLGVEVQEKRQSIPENNKHAAIAPGLLERHYSPKTPLYLVARESLVKLSPESNAAYVYLARPSEIEERGHIYWLSESGRLEEVARTAYDLLRRLDQKSYEKIYLETPPAEGIGIALLDRLQRAASKRG